MPDTVPASLLLPPAANIISEVLKIIAAFPNNPGKINVLPVFGFKSFHSLQPPVTCGIFNSSKNQRIFLSNLKLSRKTSKPITAIKKTLNPFTAIKKIYIKPFYCYKETLNPSTAIKKHQTPSLQLKEH